MRVGIRLKADLRNFFQQLSCDESPLTLKSASNATAIVAPSSFSSASVCRYLPKRVTISGPEALTVSPGSTPTTRAA